MKVILLEDVKTLGKTGDIVNVSNGYAHNLLLPRGLASEATTRNLNDLKLKKQQEEKAAAENLEEAKKLAELLQKKEIEIPIKVGSAGKTFGSVSSKEIAEAVKDQLGLEIDKKKVLLEVPIREIGIKDVGVRLHPKVTANLKVNVKEA